MNKRKYIYKEYLTKLPDSDFWYEFPDALKEHQKKIDDYIDLYK